MPVVVVQVPAARFHHSGVAGPLRVCVAVPLRGLAKRVARTALAAGSRHHRVSARRGRRAVIGLDRSRAGEARPEARS